MATKNLFTTIAGKLARRPDLRNEAGGPAYTMPPKQALAQYAATGCFNATFYASAAEQLDRVLGLARDVEPDFVARTAIFARSRAHMKDMPALLVAVLAARDVDLCRRVFARVIDNGRMLRTFVQILRSGVAGRKSLGTAPRRLVREWLDARTDDALFRASVGSAPSLTDIIRMVHPKPAVRGREALYGYLLGRGVAEADLPLLVQQYEQFKRGDTLEAPDVPFEMLTALPLARRDWIAIARHASWQTTRMNLSTFVRHDVFAGAEGAGLARLVADRLRDPDAIARARALPYQLLVAYTMADEGVPRVVRDALQDALEIATRNVPALGMPIAVCPDVSGSMQSPVTGRRKGATSKVRCVDVAALVAAAFARANPDTVTLPFSDGVVPVTLNMRDSVMTLARQLASLPSGGTNCSAPLRRLNDRGTAAGMVIMISDNQSWVDAARGAGSATAMMKEWSAFLRRNPGAKLVCIDVQPYAHTQAPDRPDVLNVGGFSDQVFELVGTFAAGKLGAATWVEEIERVEL